MFASAARPSAAAGKRVADTKANIPPKHLQVLPLGKNKTQKVVVGDSTGVAQCFSVKAGDVALAFKTLPSNGGAVRETDLGKARLWRRD